MRFVHSHGILHRDLKPDNLMLVDGNVLKIIDFGLSKILATPCNKFSLDVSYHSNEFGQSLVEIIL